MNLFNHSIETGNLLDFSLGKGIYFLKDMEYDEHWILGSWNRHVVPFINMSEHDIANAQINLMFQALINANEISLTEKVDALVYHTHVFYCLKKTNKIGLEISILPQEDEMKELISELKSMLLKTSNLTKLESINKSISFIKNNGGLLSI